MLTSTDDSNDDGNVGESFDVDQFIIWPTDPGAAARTDWTAP